MFSRFGVNCSLVFAYFVVCYLRCLVYVLFLATCYVFGVVLGAVSC